MLKPIYIQDISAISPLGFDMKTQWQALLQQQSGISASTTQVLQLPIVSAAIDEKQLNALFQQHFSTVLPFSRVEKMLLSALHPLVKKYGIGPKTALLISTTKGNVDALDTAQLETTFLYPLAQKISTLMGFHTTPIVVSNACVSGVLAVSMAKRLIQMQQFDSAYVIAADALSDFVLSGFQSFQAMSATACRPFDQQRDGVTLGEAAAAVYLNTSSEKALVEVVGDASCNDANHISGPSRTGEGLYRCISAALKEANVKVNEVDFVSAHGTATIYNDEMEAIAFTRSGLQNVPMHSLKGYFGHTLGASGLLELVFLIESMRQSKTIVSKGYTTQGTTLPLCIEQQSQNRNINIALKTASGFGGCNTALVVKKVTHE